MVEITQNIDLDNAEFQSAWDLIKRTHTSVFLTGKAGTGKSTFLKYICANTKKKYVVLAPTGIAAVNVGGQTLHSFFKIPFKPLVPDDPDFAPNQIRKTLRYTKEKVKLIQNLELIIIDEISMVRADIIDFIDRVLRVYSHNMREPFGGKQLLFVGDIFQLEPVVTRDMREILRRFYSQFYFFNAHVFDKLGLVPIELKKIYRQTDNDFISMLDRVRVNHATMQDLMMLNGRFNPQYKGGDEFGITLATRRDTVDSINTEHMNALTTPEHIYVGEIDGKFPESDLPTNKELVLKEGAQVIFIRNDKEGRWVNGTIAKVSQVSDKSVKVVMEYGDEHELEVEQWENMQYAYDEKEKKVIEHVLGTFKQYPIKPAWALTVHKSQGLTFNNVVIDFAGGAFTSGQTYVALSRCTSLEGITLLKPLQERDIIVSTAVVNFSRQFNNQVAISSALEQERAATLYRDASFAFDHSQFRESVERFAEAMTVVNVIHNPAVQRLLALKMQRFNALKDEVALLKHQIEMKEDVLRTLANEYVMMGHQSLGYGDLANEEEEAYGTKDRLDEISIKSAMANYNKALRICPDHAEAKMGKAKLLDTLDERDAAESLYQEVLTSGGHDYEVHLALGQMYVRDKDTSKAIKSFKRAIKANKKAPQPYEILAEIYDRIGLEELAEEATEKAKQLRETQKKKNRKKK